MPKVPAPQHPTEYSLNWQTVTGVLVSGHRVASGQSAESPYPDSTIRLQQPYFAARGLDLSACFAGTLNISIAPWTFRLRQPAFYFPQVQWLTGWAAEDFSFIHCRVQPLAPDGTTNTGPEYVGWVYYPHPETKLGHFQNPSTLEVLAPPIPGMTYGDSLRLSLPQTEIEVL